MTPLLSRLFSPARHQEKLPEPPVDIPSAGVPATFNLVPRKDDFKVGEHYETYFMSSYCGFTIRLISSPIELTLNDEIQMEEGQTYEIARHHAKITSRKLTREDPVTMQATVEVSNLNGTVITEFLTIRIDENSVIRPNSIWMPRQLSVNIGEEKFIPVSYNPTDYSCPGLECRTMSEPTCKVNIYSDLISVRGLRPGTTVLKVNPEGFRDLACITRVNVREDVTLRIMAEYDSKGDPKEFTVCAESEHGFPYRMAVIISYVQGRNHDVILVNGGDGEKDFMTNSTMTIPHLAKTLRDMHRTRVHALQIDFTLLQIDRRFYNMNVIREFENGKQWWRNVPTEKTYRKEK